MMIEGSLLLSTPIVKHFQAKSSVFWAKNLTVGGINRGLILNLSVISPKRHILA